MFGAVGSLDLKRGVIFPFFQISGNVCEWREALKIFVKPDTIVEAESFNNLALIWSRPVALLVFRSKSSRRTNDSSTSSNSKL